MLKNIFNTFFTKALTASINLVTVIVLSQALGAEGKGISSIILTTVSFILVFSNLFAGTTIVYFIPRVSNPALILLGYMWTLVTCAVGVVVLKITGLVPNEFIWHITVIAGIQSLLVVHSKWLLGKEEVVKSNLITIVQSVLMLVGVSGLFYWKATSINSYILALYISFGSAYILSVWDTRTYWTWPDFGQLSNRFKEIFIYGMYNQADNVLYLLTLRANFYLLEHFHGSASLGIYSNGVALAEAVWLITYSVSLVLYARLVNSDDVTYARQITWRLAKMTFFFSAVGVSCAAVLPAAFYKMLFGSEFADVPIILWIYAPGVAIFSCALVVIHYYSGIGRFRWNAIFSAIGFSLVMVTSLVLISAFGYIGAAISASFAYSVTGIIVMWVFAKEIKLGFADMRITQDDISFMLDWIKKQLFKQKR